MTRSGTWWLYLVGCADGSIYTGVAVDVARRICEHRAGAPRGARYLRGRGPLRLLVAVPVGSRSEACSAEYWVKRCSSADKLEFSLSPESLKVFVDTRI